MVLAERKMSRSDATPNPATPSPVAFRPVHHLNQIELSRRWKVSPRTLERWRWLGQGPRFMKLGGRVAYRLEDIEAFEAGQLREITPRSRKPRSRGGQSD
jgi:hypothetical protein